MPFYLKCRFCLFPKSKYIYLDGNLLSFTSLMTNMFIFRIFWTLLPQLWSEHLRVLLHWKVVLPKIMPFYLECQFCLCPTLKNTFIHVRLKSSVFYEFNDGYISFLDVLDLSLLKCDQNTLGYCFSELWCCQKKSISFYLKCQSCLGLQLNT